MFAHEADVPLAAGDDDAFAAVRALRERRFAEWGIPSDKQAELAAFRTEFEGVAGGAGRGRTPDRRRPDRRG